MRVLVLTTSFPSKAYPGSGIFIRRMLMHLPANVRITVLTPDHDQGFVSFHDSSIRVKTFSYAPQTYQLLAHRPGGLPVNLKRHPALWLWTPLFLMALLFATFVEARKVDLICAQWSLCGAVAGLVGQILGKPVVATLRGEDVHRAGTAVLFRLMLRACAKLNNHLITVSEALKVELQKSSPLIDSRVAVIPNGVGLFSPNGSKSHAGRRICITIGSLIPRKQMETVIQAFAITAPAKSDFALHIVGDGPEREFLENRVASLGVSRQVKFTGMLDPEQIPERLSRSAVFLLASTSEGRPNVILEAMAARVPVVASDIPGVREMIGADERGLLFPVGDAGRCAACMDRLLNDAALSARLTANAGQWLLDQGLTWQRTAGRYAALFERVVREHERRKK